MGVDLLVSPDISSTLFLWVTIFMAVNTYPFQVGSMFVSEETDTLRIR